MGDIFEQYYRAQKRHIEAKDAPKSFGHRSGHRVRKLSSMLHEADEIKDALTGGGDEPPPDPQGGEPTDGPPPPGGDDFGGPPPPGGGPGMGPDAGMGGQPSGDALWQSIIAGVTAISQSVNSIVRRDSAGTGAPSDQTYELFKTEIEKLLTELSTGQGRGMTPQQARTQMEDAKTNLELALKKQGPSNSPENYSAPDVLQQVVDELERLMLQIDTGPDQSGGAMPPMPGGPDESPPPDDGAPPTAGGGDKGGDKGGEGKKGPKPPPPPGKDRNLMGPALNL